MKHIWSKLRISRKLILSFLLVTILSSSTGFFSLYLMKTADSQYSAALVNYGFSQGDIGLLMESLKENTANVVMTMATHDPAIIQEAKNTIEENSAIIDQSMANIEPTLMGDAERAFYNTIKENLPQFTEHSLEVMSLAEQRRNDDAMALYQDEAMAHIEMIQEAIDGLMNSNRTEGTRLSDSLTKQSNLTIVFMLGVSILSVIISMTLAVFIARSVSKPMAECSERLVHLANGDLSMPVPVVKSEDETGILANATEELVERLKAVISQMTNLLGNMADGNLDMEYTKEFSGDFAPLHTSSSKIIDSLNDAFLLINQSAAQVDTGSDQVSDSSQALAQGAAEQASSIEELAATINNISDQVKQNADNAQEARMESEKQDSKLDESSEKMERMVSAMDKINSKSGEIGKIIKTIEDIAFQTNILALNAAVEAARAGAAGKGFAVVADEVRNLAGKSGEAAKQTTTLISETIEAVDDGTAIAAATADALKEVVSSSRRVAQLVDRIAESSVNQASSVSQVTIGVDQISGVIQTNSATAQESAAASEELAGQARVMKDLVNRFKLKN